MWAAYTCQQTIIRLYKGINMCIEVLLDKYKEEVMEQWDFGLHLAHLA